MSKNYKVSDLILFLTFLQEEMMIKKINFIHAALDPVHNFIEFMVLDSKNKNNVHSLKILDSIKEAMYFSPDYAKNPKQISLFSEWLKTREEK